MSALADTALAHEFPSLDRDGLVYLDSGATSQTPRTVLDAMDDYYAHHRGERAPRRLPAGGRGDRAVRGRARAHRALRRTGARRRRSSPRNATEALNLVAYAWGDANVGPGDRVVVTEMEHHSNFVPWQQLALRRGAAFSVVGVDDEGRLRPRRARRACWRAATSRSSPSRTSPTCWARSTRSRRSSRRAHDGRRDRRGRRRAGRAADPGRPRRDRGRLLRAGPGTRPTGPTGIGVLHGRARAARGDAAVPHRRAHDRLGLRRADALGAELPAKFEAGTSNDRRGDRARRRRRLPAGRSGWSTCARTSASSSPTRWSASPPCRASRSTARATPIAAARWSPSPWRASHPHDVAEILGREGVCVRAGHHCAQPLMRAPRRRAPRRARRSRCTTPRGRRRAGRRARQVQKVFA